MKKLLAVGVIVLFLGVAIAPSINANIGELSEGNYEDCGCKDSNVQPEYEINIEPKDYLFQTIIDTANNPDVKNLLEYYDNDLLKVDIDRSVYRKILFRNPRLLFNMLFTKPSMTIEYLNKCYNKGIEITNILGEDKVLEMMDSVEVTNIKLFNELNNIISKDEELTNRLTTLKEMNKELNLDWGFPITCLILLGVFTYEFVTLVLLFEILGYGLLPGLYSLIIFFLLIGIKGVICNISITFLNLLECW
ncbi:hypothetical protein MBGDF03_00359 [Thermoplasmatales archaeon SCGC AB-540-F20]|nr:hypothetical protein MBGDF03_00359 [Thermoplasmatales archaeon SCGC AB-540-F20]